MIHDAYRKIATKGRFEYQDLSVVLVFSVTLPKSLAANALATEPIIVTPETQNTDW
jgi:hypothetical protein